MTTQYIELSPDGQAGQKPKVGNHIIDWVRSPNFISRYATCVCYQCKRHVTCETVNKSFRQKQSRKLGIKVTVFLPVKRTETFKDKNRYSRWWNMPSPVFLYQFQGRLQGNTGSHGKRGRGLYHSRLWSGPADGRPSFLGTVPGQTSWDVWKNMFRNLNNQESSQSLPNEKECSTIKRFERRA